jgi:hypothetical protein
VEGRLLSWRHHWVDATSQWLGNRVQARLPEQACRRTMSCSGRGTVRMEPRRRTQCWAEPEQRLA